MIHASPVNDHKARLRGGLSATTHTRTSHPMQHLHDTLGNHGMRSLARRGLSASQPAVRPVSLQRQPAPGSCPVARDDSALLVQRQCAECAQEDEPRLRSTIRINHPGDAFEREADRVAEQVMRMPATGAAITAMPPQISHKCCACAEEDAWPQRKAAGATEAAGDTAPGMVHDVLRGPGDPLDASSRAYFEPRFGRNLGDVRIHRGGQAADSARAVNALAYTAGQHIVFGAGAAGAESEAGRRLLAHELTHTVQQSSYASPVGAGSATLQRQPEQQQASSLAWLSPFGSYRSDFHPLSFKDAFHAGPIDLTSPASLRGERDVNETNIIEWATQFIWENVRPPGGTDKTEGLIKLLRRGEVPALHSVWHGYVSKALATIEPFGWTSHLRSDKVLILYPSDNPFIGPSADRQYWAKYLFSNWVDVDARLDQKVADLLVAQIKETLHSGLIPAGSMLVTDPQIVRQIEDAPVAVPVPLGRWDDTASVGFQWMGKVIKSTEFGGLFFELTGHEGIYFEISTTSFVASDPFYGKVISDVVAGTQGVATLGKFIKGFLTALASPVVMVADTAAKVFDMESMAFAAFGKWTGWYDIGYTCLSSTCQQYEACVNTTDDTDKCADQTLKQAFEEATIIIPLYRQGEQCLKGGDAEACGAIAAMALGLVVEGGGRLSKGGFAEAGLGEVKAGKALTPGEFEDTAIREAIGRPHPGDVSIAEALEKPTAVEETAASPAEPTPAAKPLKSMEAVSDLKREVDRFAGKSRIKPQRLEAEVDQLLHDATDQEKVHRPDNHDYDAEMKTSVDGEEHSFDRKRGTRFWCRFSPGPPDCGVPVGPELDLAVDASLRESEAAAARPAGEAAPAKPANVAPVEPPPAQARRVGMARERVGETRAGLETKQVDVELARSRLARLEEEHAVAQDLATLPGGPELLRETESRLNATRGYMAEFENLAQQAEADARVAAELDANVERSLAELADVNKEIDKIYESARPRQTRPPGTTPEGKALRVLEEQRDKLIKQVERDTGRLTGELTTAQKGEIGEAKADAHMANEGFKKEGSSKRPSLEGGGAQDQGLDGVYRNAPGKLPKWVVGEAKYVTDPVGKPTYGESAAGKQGTQPWSDANLDQAVGRQMADEIRRDGYEFWELRYDPASDSVVPTSKFVARGRYR
jgi:hypothetical protein